MDFKFVIPNKDSVVSKSPATSPSKVRGRDPSELMANSNSAFQRLYSFFPALWRNIKEKTISELKIFLFSLKKVTC